MRPASRPEQDIALMTFHHETSESTANPDPSEKRVFACVLCHQRKVKCDRTFPCANCIRANVQCMSSFAPRQRRRRLPERILLERLRHYESLLRESNIEFEPLHPHDPAMATPRTVNLTSHIEDADSNGGSRGPDPLDDAHSEISKESTAVRSDKRKTVDFWQAIGRVTPDSDDSNEKGEGNNGAKDTDSYRGLKHGNNGEPPDTWDYTYQNESSYQGNDRFPYGPLSSRVDLSAVHPKQVQIFRLWQIYLENIDPLLKVTHAPSLQARVIDAAGNLTKISPTLEALIFSIYCVSVMSLTEDECRTLFGSPRKDLLASYQFACQQALLNCMAWRCDEIDSLTALFLYLVSIRPQIDPRSLSSMLAVAIRTAQRMGIDSESTYTRYTPLEAETRRRLWWALVIFDHRNCEICDYRTTTLTPVWDCRTPHNLNDFEISSERAASPSTQDRPSEALFAFVRSELADFLRNSVFHLNFVNPSLITLAQTRPACHESFRGEGELLALEKAIEERYLVFCDPRDPFHYMTIWTTRGFLARSRLLRYYSVLSTSHAQKTNAQRNDAVSYALSMLECDTKLRASPHIKKFLWLIDFYTPALAYVHILNELKKRPSETYAESAWDIMNSNYEARAEARAAMHPNTVDQNAFAVFSRVVLQAWGAREALLGQQGKVLEPPYIVSDVKNKAMPEVSNFPLQDDKREQLRGPADDLHPLVMPTPMDFGGQGPEAQSFTELGSGGYPGYLNLSGQFEADFDVDQFWTMMDWRFMQTQGW